MEAGREDLGLRTILAVGRDDATGAKRPSSVDPEQMSDMPVGDLHERRREYAEADDDEPHRAKCILDKPVSVLSRNQRRCQKQDDGACGHPEDQTQHVSLQCPHSCELALITRVAVPNRSKKAMRSQSVVTCLTSCGRYGISRWFGTASREPK